MKKALLHFLQPLKKVIRSSFLFLFTQLINFYRLIISPFFSPSCRFTPTCSSYALEALNKYGPWKGSFLTLQRILKCHPWGSSGYDPVP